MGEPRILKTKRAYLRTFCGDGETPHVNGDLVLAELKRFCRVQEPGIVVSKISGMTDSHASLYLAGLRDVYMHITGLLGIDESQLFKETKHVEKIPTANT